MLETGNPDEVVTVAEEDGRIVGFHGLVDEGDCVELLRMLLETDVIGRGYGVRLWAHAVEAAKTIGDWMRILSDPGARGFCERRGAVLEKDFEPYSGFVMGIYWYDLTSD
jgi:GNAT superfamily N-acetyltransferase